MVYVLAAGRISYIYSTNSSTKGHRLGKKTCAYNKIWTFLQLLEYANLVIEETGLSNLEC